VTVLPVRAGGPWQNAWIESFNGKLRDELLNGWQFDSLLKARVMIEDWRIDYNWQRPHTAHGDLTPSEFAAKWNSHQPTPSRIPPGPPTGSLSTWRSTVVDSPHHTEQPLKERERRDEKGGTDPPDAGISNAAARCIRYVSVQSRSACYGSCWLVRRDLGSTCSATRSNIKKHCLTWSFLAYGSSG
jgi:hypothetical protein